MTVSLTQNVTFVAPNYVVTTNQDDAGNAANCTPQAALGTGTDAACSLRDALAAAASLTGVSPNITFDKTVFSPSNTVAQNTITEGSVATFLIPPGATIAGPTTGTGITIDGARLASVFTVNSGTVAISGLTIVHGAGTKVSGEGLLGGGIFLGGGTLTVEDCTLANNSAGDGGAIMVSGGSVTFISSTLTLNSSTNSAGAINSQGNVTLIGSTVSGNSASYYAGGIDAYSGSLPLSNSVVSGNSSQFSSDIYGGVTNKGGNVIGSAAINLSALGSYGGSFQTLLPLPGSPAICAGTLANAQAAGLTTGERGFGFDPSCRRARSTRARCRHTTPSASPPSRPLRCRRRP